LTLKIKLQAQHELMLLDNQNERMQVVIIRHGDDDDDAIVNLYPRPSQ